MNKIFFLCLIMFCSNLNAETETCNFNEKYRHVQKIADELNANTGKNQMTLMHTLNSFQTATEKRVFIASLTADNQVSLWRGKLQRALKKQTLSASQRDFIDRLATLVPEIFTESEPSPDFLPKLQLLEIEAVELFGLEQAKVLFTVRGRRNSAPVDSLSANYDIRPPCDCRTDSMFACTGCRLKGQNCYWMNRGCGFMDAYSCNGKCPIQ